jgi:hypothetical protein
MGGAARGGFLCLLALSACGAGKNAGSADSCPLTPEGRSFLADLSISLEREVEFTTDMSGSDEVATWWSLAAAPEQIESTAHLASPCLGPTTDFGTTCMSDTGTPMIAPGVDACFRSNCEAAGIPFADVFLTQPNHPSPDDRTTISYPSAAPYPSGRVTYSPNPLTHWRYDYSQPEGATVSAALARSPVVALDTGETLDLTFSGKTEGVQVGSDRSFSTSVSFSRLASRGAIQVTIKNYSNAPLVGSAILGSETLATIADDGFHWQGACAPDATEGADAN